MNEHDDSMMRTKGFECFSILRQSWLRCIASQVNRSRFAQWRERRRSSFKSEWVSSNWPWSRTQPLCHAMLLDALISTPPTAISSSSQGNGSERASADPEFCGGNSEHHQVGKVLGNISQTQKTWETAADKSVTNPISVITISSSVHIYLSKNVSRVFLQLVVSSIVSLSEN